MFGSVQTTYRFFVAHIAGEEPGNFDSVIINDDLEKAYSDLKNKIHKVREMP